MKLKSALLLLFCPLLLACSTRTETPLATTVPAVSPVTTPSPQVYARPIDRAIADGVAFLKADQNSDGSWGTGMVTHGNEVDVSVPGSHDAFRVAVTCL